MKKLVKFKNKLGHRNFALSIVALILVLLTAVSVSYSWIEEVSNVKLSTDENAQQTPLHISGKKIKSDVNVTRNGTAVDLSDFFYESGDMHLSACYSDGTNFYFPKSGNMATSNTAKDNFRLGTKSDANVNYISTTFRVKSNGAPTAYWFEYKDKNSSNPFVQAKNYTGATDAAGTRLSSNATSTNNTAIKNALRASITVNGATTVYGFNSDGSFKYMGTSSVTSAATALKRPVTKYMYYTETNTTSNPISNGLGYWITNATNKGRANQGAYDGSHDNTRNLNGNTLFTIGKDKTETVTVKIWLECNTTVTAVDLSDLNLQITSNWVKTRRIYVVDNTDAEYDLNGGFDRTANWLHMDGTEYLYWAINDNDTASDRTHWQMTRNGNVYYVDVPAVYNNYPTALYRCKSTWNTGNDHTGDIKYYDKWDTTFPNTYHGEAYSVYSHEYGTWETSGTNHVDYINSGGFANPTTENGSSSMWPRSYLWQSGTEVGTNHRVVENAAWPGAKMTPMTGLFGEDSHNKFRQFRTYYSSSFDYGVFSDGKGAANNSVGYQTQDLALSGYENKVFDMATLSWFDNTSGLPTYTKNYLYSNFGQNGTDWADTCFTYKSGGSGIFADTSGNKEVCRVYVKSTDANPTYEFKVRIRTGNDTYTYYGSNDGQLTPSNWRTLSTSGGNVTVKLSGGSHKMYRVYLQWNNGTPQVLFDGPYSS